MRDFRELKVWQKAHALTLEVYRVTAEFPGSELYGLTRQLRRAASSIPSNIAEGCGRGSDADFGRFLQMALGSASELEYQLLLCHDLGLLSERTHQGMEARTTESKRMLASFLQKLKADR